MNDDLMAAVTFGPDQPQRFLQAWLGPPSRDPAESAASGLPAALAAWHRQVARWDVPIMRQNRVPAQRELDGDALLVGVECQAVWLWGVREDGDNPQVWERENTAGMPWTATAEHLDEFLWHFTLVEAVFGTSYGMGANNVTKAEHDRFTSGWADIGVKPWRWPGPEHALWTRAGLLAWTMVNDRPDALVTAASYFSIFVAARSNHQLAAVGDAGIDWDWDSRNDT
jgi:hypothetical protein